MQTMFPPTAAVGFQGHPTNTPPANQNVIRHNCRVALIGTKVQSPLMNICRSCNSPIILHGRFIPCKHIMCVTCAASITSQECPICNQKFNKIEQNSTVFICPFQTPDNAPCERSYLSERDLVAHVKMRHDEIDVEKFSAGKPLVLPSRESYVNLPMPKIEILPMVPTAPVSEMSPQQEHQQNQNAQPISTIGHDVDHRQSPGSFRGQYQPRHQGYSPRGGPYSRPDFQGSPRGRGGYSYRPRYPYRPRGNWNQSPN